MNTISVLHVDDDPDLVDLVATFLEREREEIVVLTETDPGDARERFETESGDIDCVVSDYDMPGMHGLELLEELHEIDPEIPFVLFTGHGNEAIASEAISAGVTDYLRKGTGTDQYAVLANRVVNAVSKRRAERELERRTEQFERIFEFSRDALFVFDPVDETISECNTAACAMLGYEREDLLALSPEAVQPDQMGSFHSFIDGVLETGEGWTDGFTYLTSDGRQLSSEISASRIDLDGRPHVLASVREITDRKEREAELERSRARFRALTENATFAVLTMDANSTIRYANDATEGLLGYVPDELVGESLATVIPDRLDERHFAAVARYLREGERRLDWEWVELPARHRDGHEVPVGISFGEYVADGEHVFTGVLRDISERKERERKLERSEGLLGKTQRMASVGGWELDLRTDDLRTDDLRWTTEVNRIYGFELDHEPALSEALDAFVPEDRTRLEAAMERTIDDGEDYDLEARLHRADGDVRWVRALGEPYCENGRTVVLRGTIQDITDRKERERELRSTRDVLSTLLSSIPAGVLAESSSREVLFANRSFCELFSISGDSDDLVGADCAAAAEDIKELFVDSERFVEGNDAVSENRSVSREEFALVDGRTVERSGTPIPVSDGEDRYLWLYHDITERKQVEQTLRALHEGTREMMEATTRERVCEIAAETSKRVLGHSITVVRLLADDGETLVPTARTAETRERIGDRPAYSIYGTPAGKAFREGVPQIHDDLASLDEASLDASYDRGNSRAAMYVPLGTHGVISIADTDADRFDRSDLQLAKVLGANAETALDRVSHERTLESLHEGTRAMMDAETSEEVAELVVETARDALGLALTGCWLYDPDAVCLRPAAFTEEAHAMFDDFPTYTAGNSLSWKAFVAGELALYDAVADQPGAYDPASSIASEIVVPIGEYGVLNTGSTEVGQFDALDVSAARILAANAEAALVRAEREALLRDRETQLGRERDNLAALFENVPDPMYRYHREDGTVIPDAVNPAFERVFGYEDEQVVGRPITETIVPAEMIDEHEAISATASAGASLDTEVERLTATGWRTFLLRNAPIDAPIDTRTAGYAIYTDVTERREVEGYRRRLYEVVADAEATSAERIRGLLDLGRERLGVETAFVARIDDDTVRVTESLSAHDGMESGDEHPLSEVYCRRTIASADPITVIGHVGASDWMDDPAYERLGVETYVGLQLVVDDDLYGTVCFVDRTPRETDFSAVELAFADLVTRAITSELERRRYERELERQNERLEQFASVLSHDLRNPLGIAEGYLSFLPEAGNEESLEKVRAAHDRMERIIEDVLALTRQGETVVDPGTLPLAAVAETAWEHVETGHARLVTADDLGDIEADRSRLETLFENLFRNAITHAGENATVRVERTNTGFAVSDDGPGIPSEEREQVFEYGHTTGSGTGLGLSIVRTVADAHGWEVVAAESDSGGACFEISIPDAASR